MRGRRYDVWWISKVQLPKQFVFTSTRTYIYPRKSVLLTISSHVM